MLDIGLLLLRLREISEIRRISRGEAKENNKIGLIVTGAGSEVVANKIRRSRSCCWMALEDDETQK